MAHYDRKHIIGFHKRECLSCNGWKTTCITKPPTRRYTNCEYEIELVGPFLYQN